MKAFSGCVEICELLIGAGANVNCQDYSFGDCYTPLHKSLCKFLETNSKDSKHSNSHRQDLLRVCICLLQYKAETTIKNGDGITISEILLNLHTSQLVGNLG